ncbi:MAG: hypothetical protein SGILL_005332 [Bacillariaceae sp.]
MVADRKTKPEFDVKSFIFSHEPSGWSFGCTERLCGVYEQLIDITDDATGEPHQTAKDDIAMHLNEVGHDKTLVKNVEACEDHAGRVVEYLININDIMQKGDQVELLTSYGPVYEEVRQRKGYGLANTKGEIKSDDDPYCRYERNFDNREVVMTSLERLNVQRLYWTMDFVDEKIRAPLAMLINTFLSSATNGGGPSTQTVVPSALQWVAFYPLFLQLDESLADSNGVNIRKAVEVEILEHVWYDLHKDLLDPFNKTIWCPVACDLVGALSKDVALLAWTGNPNLPELLRRIYTRSMSAAKRIRDAASSFNNGGHDFGGLEFEAGVAIDAKVTLGQVQLLYSGFSEDHSLNAKGLVAALNELQAYADATSIAQDDPLPRSFTLASRTINACE